MGTAAVNIDCPGSAIGRICDHRGAGAGLAMIDELADASRHSPSSNPSAFLSLTAVNDKKNALW